MATTIQSGYANSPKLTADVASRAEVYGGRGLVFDGVADYLDTGDAFESFFKESFTLSTWIKPDDGQPSAINSIINTRNGFAGYIYFQLETNGKIKFVHGANLEKELSITTDNVIFSDGASSWTHVVGVFNKTSNTSGSVTIYVNGENAGSSSSPASSWNTGNYSNSAYNVVIGARNSLGSIDRFFNGSITDVKFYSSALSESDIRSQYLKPESVPSPSTLKTWYPMSEGNPESPQSIVYDHSEKKLGAELASDKSWYGSGTPENPNSGIASTVNGITHTVTSTGAGASYRPSLIHNLTSGVVYKLVFTPISKTGTVNGHLYADSAYVEGGNTIFDGNSTKTYYYKSSGGQLMLNLGADNEFNITFTFSVKPVLMGNHATTNFFGNELVTNGDFSNGATGWSNIGTGWDLTGGNATSDNSQTGSSKFDQNINLIQNHTYRITYDWSFSAGGSSVLFYLQSNYTSWLGTAGTGKYVDVTYTGSTGAASFQVYTGADSDGTIDNISVKEVGISSTGFLPVTNEPVIPQIPLVKSNEKMLFSDANYVNCGALLGDDLSGGITISLWFNATAIATNNGLFSFNSTLEFASIFDNNKVAWYLNGVEWSKSSTITLGKTYHVVFSLDTDSHANSGIYINGVKDSTGTATNFPLSDVLDLASTSFLIGRYNSDAFSHDGLIDDVAMFNVALDSTQIQEIFNDGIALDATTHSKSGNLLGYWRNDGVSTWQDRRGWSNLSFDGINDYISIADNDTLSFGNSAHTIMAWANLADIENTYIFSKGHYGSNYEYNFHIGSDKKLYWVLFDQSSGGYIGRIFNTALDAYENHWVHFCGTYSGSGTNSGIKLYINGVQVDDTNGGVGTYTSMENLGAEVRIMRHNTNYSNGQLANLSVYSDEKSASDVLSAYNNGVNADQSSNSNIIGYWKFNNSTTVTDLINGNNGTVNEATLNTGNNGNVAGSPDSITIREGLNSNKDGLGFPLTNPTSNVLRLNGIDEYVELPVSKGLQSQSALTLEAWIKCNSKSSAGGIIVKDDTTNRVFNLTVLESSSGSANKVIFNIYSGGSGQSVTSTSVVADGNWHHIVGVFEPSVKQAIYIDGKLETKDTSSIPSTIDLSTDEANTPIRIGSFENNSLYFKGLLDEVKIYNRALTDGGVSVGSMANGEIKKNYKHQKGKHKND